MDNETVKNYFCKYNNPAVAFSGGVDSSVLLALAKKYCPSVCAYYVKSQLQPDFELRDALLVCEKLGVELNIINCDVLSDSKVRENGINRCYFCKKEMMTRIVERAKLDGCDAVLEGTNADDDVFERPGFKAVQELSVLSPLKTLGISKEKVRAIARELYLPTYNKPAYACLATRIPHGSEISLALLIKTEKAENLMKSLGFNNFRVRYREDNTALIQLDGSEFELFTEKRKEIYFGLSELYSNVYYDLKDR